MATKKPEPTFEVRFVGPGLLPERIPLRAVSEALSAVQDLASGRDPFETQQVPPDKAIGLLDVRRGSAVYSCVSRAPEEAVANLGRVAKLLSTLNENVEKAVASDGLVNMLRPIQYLSEVAKSLGCRLEVALAGRRLEPLFAVSQGDFQRLSSQMLFTGETTIIGNVKRAGGATEMKCLLRIPGRRRMLYCDVKTKEIVQKLGQHLYEDIAVTGTATWIHRSWYIYKFTITDFSQPRLGNPKDAIESLRKSGLSAWDKVQDPVSLIEELRS